MAEGGEIETAAPGGAGGGDDGGVVGEDPANVDFEDLDPLPAPEVGSAAGDTPDVAEPVEFGLGAEDALVEAAYESPYGELIATEMKVVTWNLWWRFGPWEQRLDAIRTTLAELDADVYAFQEVWEEGDSNLAAILAEGLGYHHVFRSWTEHEGVRFGNAVVSRWPIGTSRWIDFGDPEGSTHRNALMAEIEGPRGPLQVFCTHLNWKLFESGVRQRQVGELARFVADCRPRRFPAVVCGDFNAEPTSDEIAMMTGLTTVPVPGLAFFDAWRVGGDGASSGHTWSNRNPFAAAVLEPDRRIDYVFTGWPRAGGAGHVVGCRVVGDSPVAGVWPSDHFGVEARLRY